MAAKDAGRTRIVSVSAEAFTLLLIDNYLDKWKAMVASKEAIGAEAVGDEGANKMQEVETGDKTKAIRTAGKYTAK